MMIRLCRNLTRDQQGSTIVLVGLTFILLLTVTGLVVDGGTMYAAKSHLQKTANAAALSAAQELTHSESDVNAVVNDILQRHREQTSLTATDIQMKSTVRVHLSKKVPLSFSRLFGKKDVTVSVAAAAQIAPMGSAIGAAPLGIDESVDLAYYTPYVLHQGPHNGDSGFFGILDLGGRGSSIYEENLTNGYQGELTVGKILDTETGIKNGATVDGVDFRLKTDPYPAGEYRHRDSPRVLLIPVYRPWPENDTSNQMKQVMITGFAYFYITGPVTSNKEIVGMFIENADTGFVKPGAVDKGAFAIRLIE
jgi:hypothetical protein